MTTDILIRPERADHPQVVAALGALDAYLASLYAPEANHILSIGELLAPEVSFFAAWQGDRVVGTAAVRAMGAEAETGARPYGEIKRMYVAPTSRGQRLGRRLVDVLESRLRALDLPLALLETGIHQVEAIRLYERCGYRRRGPFAGYPDNGLSMFMAKELG